jgi:hypothetical protein
MKHMLQANRARNLGYRWLRFGCNHRWTQSPKRVVDPQTL